MTTTVNNNDVTRRFTGSILIASRTGGVGGTAIAQIIESALAAKGVEIDLYAVDFFGGKSDSALKRVLANTQDLKIGSTFAETKNGPDAAVQRFDVIYDRMGRGGALFDFSANVATSFFDFASFDGAERFCDAMPAITLVVPVMAHGASVDGALEIVEDARKALSALRIKKVIIVYNVSEGEFSSELLGYDKLKTLEMGDVDFDVTSVTLPYLHSEISERVRSTSMSFRDVMAMSVMELATKLDLPPLPSSRGKRFLNEWVVKASADFDAVGLAA